MEKKEFLNVLGIQIQSVLGDKKQNYKKIEEAVKKGLRENTDLIVLPEVWTCGWSPDLFQASAEDLKTGETLEFLKSLAVSCNSYIVGGSYITKAENAYYNTCPVVSDKGKLVGSYNKSHLYSYYGCKEGSYIKNGTEPVMVDIKGIKTGLTICYDIRFPEIYRAYRKAGADLLINVAAWGKGKEIPWQTLTSARAIENQCNFIAINQTGLIKDDSYNLGLSRVINYDGTLNCEIDETKNYLYATIKFDNTMYEFRNKCTVLEDILPEYEVKII
ncbi:hypothetical protein IJ818_04120 [bacterium]|nr:hypothetical protein [bacterium]